MRPQLWRAFILVTIVLTFAFASVDVASLGGQTTAGYRARGEAGFNRYRVTSVEAGGPAAAQGIVVGDVLSLTNNSLAERVRWLQQKPGERFIFTVNHDGATRSATIAVRADTAQLGGNIAYYVYAALRFIFLAMAFMLAWQRWQDVAARTLASFLTAAGFALAPNPLWYPPALLPVLFAGLNPLAWMVFIFQAAAFATVFPRPLEHRLLVFFRRVTPFVALVLIPYIVVSFYIVFAYEKLLPFARVVPPLFYTYCISVIAFSLSVATRQARGADVQRVRWTAATIGFGFSGLVAYLLVSLIHYAEWAEFLPLTFAAIPIGLGYVIFKHHLFDIRFVINRALVYGTISSLIVGSFGIMEWLLGKVLNGSNHATSNLIEAGTALLIGTSLSRVHRKVDATIDDVFFRDRHLAEKALLQFAAEASYITDRHILLERTVETVTRNARLDGAAIYIVEESGEIIACASSFAAHIVESVDENDRAIVAMRAHREAVDIAARGSALPGAVAFPMIVRGELVGALCCAEKTSGDALAPDERHVLQRLSHAVAVAIDVLRTAELRTQLRALLEAAGGRQQPATPRASPAS